MYNVNYAYMSPNFAKARPTMLKHLSSNINSSQKVRITIIMHNKQVTGGIGYRGEHLMACYSTPHIVQGWSNKCNV